MRRRLMLGVGLAGVLTGTAVAQFAADAKPLPAAPQTKTAPFGGAQPAAPTTPPRTPTPTPGYVQPVGGFQPAPAPAATGFTPATASVPNTPATTTSVPNTPATTPPVEIATSLGADHPWLVKPEHGAYFLCVKSYARKARPDDGGPTARQLAEMLGTEIRNTHRVNVFLFEHISDERRAEEAAIAAARKQQMEHINRLDEFKHRSQLQGMEFLEDKKHFVRYKSVNYTEQIAVLLGGFKDEESALKALATVKKWPPPKQDVLMDGGAIARQGPSGATIEKTRLNPFPQAMVVPNPSIARPRMPNQGDKVDEFVAKLNESRPYSLLKATKGWTLGVKSFSAPTTIVSGSDESTGTMRKMGTSKGADALAAGAEQAETLAKALRDPNMKPQPFEAFVLHTRNASIVTVGQFDGPNDPSLIETRRLLIALNSRFKVTEDKGGLRPVMNTQKVFTDNIMPIPIPRR